MKRIMLFLCIFLLFTSFVYAGTYLGLTPGESTKQDADKILGEPINEIIKSVRYDYNPEGRDCRRISILFNQDTQIIESISIYFKEPYQKAQLEQGLELKTPLKRSIDLNGNLVEYYEGISLHYNGPDDTYTVGFLSHEEKTQEPAREIMGRRVKEGAKPHLGVMIAEHEGVGAKILNVFKDSPAEKAGLKPEDIILELENNKFDAAGINPGDFAAIVSMMPVDKPLRFLIQRGERKFEVNIKLEEVTEQQMRAKTKAKKNEAHKLYKKGEQASEKKNYAKAIEYFKQAIIADPGEPFYYSSLGHAYRENGDDDLAIKPLKQALSLRENYFPNYALGAIYLEKKQYDTAIPYLKEAVRLRPDDVGDTAAYELLGTCYFNKDMLEDALDIFVQAYKKDRKSALTLYYLAACFDRMGNKRDAITYYKRYLRTKNKNSKMETVARTRLRALIYDPQRSRQTEQKFRKALDTVIQELKEFNQE